MFESAIVGLCLMDVAVGTELPGSCLASVWVGSSCYKYAVCLLYWCLVAIQFGLLLYIILVYGYLVSSCLLVLSCFGYVLGTWQAVVLCWYWVEV